MSKKRIIIENISKFYIRFKFLETLGKSNLSLIKEVLDKKTNKIYAAKIIEKKKISKKILYNEYNIYNEIYDLKGTPNLFKAYEDNEFLILIMQKFIKPDLADYLFKNGKLSEFQTKHIIYNLSKIIFELHKKNIIHIDIKPENLMFDYNKQLSLIDFGLSRYSNNITNIFSGTIYYLSPEMIYNVVKKKDKKNEYEITTKTDIWSLGITMYVLLFNNYPYNELESNKILVEIFNNSNKLYNKIKLKNISEQAKDLLFKCLTFSYKERISAENILKHKWFNSN